MDFLDLRGVTVSTNSLPKGVLVDGAMIDQENNLSLGREPWIFISGNGINVLAYIDPDPKMDIEAAINFLDSASVIEPPEGTPGTIPKVGWLLNDWQNVKAGNYKFFAYYSTLPGFPEGGGSGFYKATHNPVDLKVQPVTRETVSE